MRRGARASQVVNNFFTFATIVMVTIVLTLYVKYFGEDKNSTKISIPKLQCEKEFFSKAKILNLTLLKKSINALDKGYYKLDGGIIESEMMKSKIKSIINIDEIDGFYLDSIGIKPKKEIEKFLKIKYELIENDKKNPKNKKLNSGTLVTSFRINTTEIFRFNTDIDFFYKNAIKQRVECSIKVYKNYVQNTRK